MHKSFTGSSRRQRQVNLSGRPQNTNPFNARAGPQSLAAKLLDERAERQHQIALESGTRKAQRLWRGQVCRKEVARQLREEYYTQERRKLKKPSTRLEEVAYGSDDEALLQIRRLLFFVNPRDPLDQTIISRLCLRLQKTFKSSTPSNWLGVLVKLENVVLGATSYNCERRKGLSGRGRYAAYRQLVGLAEALSIIGEMMPTQAVYSRDQYYRVAAEMLEFLRSMESDHPTEFDQYLFFNSDGLANSLVGIVSRPLSRKEDSHGISPYQWFIRHFLATPGLTDGLDSSSMSQRNSHYETSSAQTFTRVLEPVQFLRNLTQHINFQRLAAALEAFLGSEAYQNSDFRQRDAGFRILGLFIYFKSNSEALSNKTSGNGLEDYSSDRTFIVICSRLLSWMVDHHDHLEEDDAVEKSDPEIARTDFLNEQVHKLVNENSLRNLVANAQASSAATQASSDSDAIFFANFSLALLRQFQAEADQMRMWLFLGPSNRSEQSARAQSAIHYFWNAAKQTAAFRHIRIDSRIKEWIVLDRRFFDSTHQIPSSAENDWGIILMFMELYTFILKVMNDDEFFSEGQTESEMSNIRITQTRASALPLGEVESLVLFLKNLGLSLYLDVTGMEPRTSGASEPRSIADLFKIPQGESRIRNLVQERPLGPTGASIDYMTNLVTGLLGMIYERDSRRPFLPPGHWLMNSRFATSFSLDEVFQRLIELEAKRSQTDDDGADEDADMEDAPSSPMEEIEDQSPRPIGLGRASRAAHRDQLRAEQHRAFKEKHKQFLKPRSTLMANMPYTIPFMERVNLFREFVKTDKMTQRFGPSEEDVLRALLSHSGPHRDRTRGKIRRGHELEDAFEQFYPIGEELKRPIQITFLDSFGSVEAGVDGGGVTKEFLTSVGKQIEDYDGQKLFVENEQNLLYPNPTVIDDVQETFPDDTEAVSDTLKRFEFVGRIVGKCLYEEILVDLNFAPFFLQKWAASNDVSRATLDDLRSYDESLYRGLLGLKNHVGDVEADFDVDFTIIDSATDAYAGKTRNITRNLHPLGPKLKVTNENRLLYVWATARHRLHVQPYRQTKAFLEGLSSMIKPVWLRMFNQVEIQTLLSGTTAPVDLADLRAHTSYSGVYVIGDDRTEHPTIQRFWAVMESLPEEDKREVLRFVTSTPRAPLLGFGSLNPPFTIRDSGRDDQRLPTASTCVNLLKLPMYSSVETLRTKLLYAVGSGAGFDLS